MISWKWVVAATMAVLTAWPQQPQDAPIIRMNVELVQVDAVVTDGKGRHVSDLKPEDFEVRQDGKVVKITNFSYVKDAGPAVAAPVVRRAKGEVAPPPAKGDGLRPADVRRTMALVVDDLALSFDGVSYVKDALQNFIDHQMEPGDLVAIMRTSRGAGALQQFTSDKRVLRAAVQQVKFSFRNRVGQDSLPRIFDERTAGDAAQGGGTGNQGSTPVGGAQQVLMQDLEKTQESRAKQMRETFERDFFAVGTLGTLHYLMAGMKPLPGRKSVVLFSENLTVPQWDSTGVPILDQLRRVTDEASRAGVVFYTVDPRGVPFLGFQAHDQVYDDPKNTASDVLLQMRDNRRELYFNSRVGLGFLAEQTGGIFLGGVNDIPGLLGKAVADQSGYYLIGYRPEEGTFDDSGRKRKYHEIKVKVLRAGLHSRSRNGFYNTSESEAESAPLTQEQRMARALVSPFAAGEIGLQLTPVFDVDGKTGPSVLTMMHIDGKNITFVDDGAGWRRASLNVLTTTFGEDGVMADSHQALFKLRMNEARYQQIQKDGLIYTTTQPLKKSGAFQFRAVVGDTNGNKLGSASEFIEVPNLKKGKLALSGILLMGGGGAQTDEEGVAAYTAGHPAIRHFRRGQKVSYGYKVLNATVKDGDPQVWTQVRLFRGDKEVFRSEPRALQTAGAKDKARLLVGGALQLGSQFEPGDYALQLVVWDKLAKGGDAVAAQAIDFELE